MTGTGARVASARTWYIVSGYMERFPPYGLAYGSLGAAYARPWLKLPCGQAAGWP